MACKYTETFKTLINYLPSRLICYNNFSMDKNHLVEEEGEDKSLNFIEQIIEEELAEGKNGGRVHTVSRRNRTGTCISGMQLLYA